MNQPDDRRDGDEIHALLRHLDHAPPQVTAEMIARRARHRTFVRSRNVAAGLLLLIGLAGVAYAVPGSPLPAWMSAIVERLAGHRDNVPPVSDFVPAQGRDAVASGIAVDPGQTLLILFTSRQAASQARIALGGGAEVAVRAPMGAATFSSGVDRLVIDNQGPPAIYEIQIPDSAKRVEIRVAGVRVFLKEGARITAPAAAGDQGRYLIQLAPPGP